MTVGQRIKKFRTDRGLSQKQLAFMCHMSEPAIRNYELGNRYPGMKQIEKIAAALGVNPYAIADPDFETNYLGIIHALFQLEDKYGLKPESEGGRTVLDFGKNHSITSMLDLWYEELTKLRNGEITQEEYDMWRYGFPRLQAEREEKERHERMKMRK